MKRLYLIVSIILLTLNGGAQALFSFCNDISLLRNFSPEQKFWALGTTVQGNFHVAPKDAPYVWFSFFTPARFSNTIEAAAKSSGTSPQTTAASIRSTWTFRNLSVGWKHYFRGAYNDETSWNLYGQAGFGFQYIKVFNDYKTSVDTSLYHFSGPDAGTKNVARLSLDLGVGVEYSVAPDYFVFADLRTWYPTSNHPSAWFHNSERTPFPFTVGIGFRILFGNY